ncbi:hypothetical protein DQ04_01881050 [Trypanosoma grayi]|uniref:hypothetical protein n=1 Tax=Trypanosoma grayi TaxID=71804 RepID=UPI0004F42B4B|nr:hypothetical protein DQ04_01881050 [Trypanosoma grayi]KEG12221.1 hypothetical protein DQ04_01881050 [Trypanosoma grayi]
MNGDAVRDENVSDNIDTEDAKKARLHDRIRQHETMEKKQGVKIVLRKGIPTPTSEELQSISERREKLISMMNLKRRIEDTARRKEEWRDCVSYEPHSSEMSNMTETKVETTSLEGRAVILSPLLALLRMLLCDNRAKRRLHRLRSRQTMLAPETCPLRVEHQTVTVATSVVEEHLATTSACGNRFASLPNLFLMTGSFDVKPLRNPFVFLSRQYQMERLPEFALNLAKAASEEYAAYKKSDYKEPSAVTLSEFVQPLVTLETFDVPKKAYDAVFGQNPVHGYELFTNTARPPQVVANTAEKRDEPHARAGSVADVGLSQELSYIGLPSKLGGPMPEDSLSESDGDEAPPGFQADISWLPVFPTQKNSDEGETHMTLDAAL